jgi:hypothetical protein
MELQMDKTNLPESFGVFKPVGHIVIAHPVAEDQTAAINRLLALGFAAETLVHYTPEQMIDQVDRCMVTATPLAAMGQELNLIKAHRTLATSGCSFLVVPAPDDERAEQVAEVARTTNALLAQRYGRFMIEELIDTPAGRHQVSESPDRGLDIPLPGQAR